MRTRMTDKGLIVRVDLGRRVSLGLLPEVKQYQEYQVLVQPGGILVLVPINTSSR